MSQDNVEVVRLAYAALNDGDLDALTELNAPDAVLDFSRSIGPQKGIYRGREEFARYMAANAEAFERFHLSPIEFVVAPGGEVVVRHHVSARGRASGVEIDRVPDVALVWELRNGKVIKTTMYQPHTEALEAVGLREQAVSDDNVEFVRRAWEAWERGDMQALFDFYDPAVEWDMSESDVPDMGVYRGHEGVRQFFREWMAPFHDYYAHAEDFTLGSEGVLVRLRQGGRGKESGVDVEMPPLWQLYRLRASRAVRVEIYRDENRAREAAGLSEPARQGGENPRPRFRC